jgi:hypothetical protein
MLTHSATCATCDKHNALQVAVVLEEYEKDRRQLQEVGVKLGAAVGSLDR